MRNQIYFIVASFVLVISADKTFDLTHDFNSASLVWPGDKPFRRTSVLDGPGLGLAMVRMGYIEIGEHVGTHIDSPSHFLKDGWDVSEIPIQRMRGPGVVIDVRDKVKDNATYQYSVADIEEWEKQNGRIPPFSVVLFCSGWYQYQNDPPSAYQGDPQDVNTFRYPALSTEAALFLVQERAVYGVGTEGPSIEPSAHFSRPDVPTHRALLRGKAWIIESLNNACQLPPRGAIVGAYPMKIKGGSGAPTRVVAVVRSSAPRNYFGLFLLCICILLLTQSF